MGLVVISELKEPILCWTQPLTRILTLMFSFVCASGPSSCSISHFLLTTALKMLANIPKQGISTLNASLLDNVTPLHRQVTREHCSTRLLLESYLPRPPKVIHLTTPVGFGTTKQLGFPLLVGMLLKPRVWLFFLMKELCCSLLRIMRE